MSIKNGQGNPLTPGSYGSTAHPKSDRMTISSQQCSAFLRGVARLLVMAARSVDDQNQLPGPYVDREQDVIEGEVIRRG